MAGNNQQGLQNFLGEDDTLSGGKLKVNSSGQPLNAAGQPVGQGAAPRNVRKAQAVSQPQNQGQQQQQQPTFTQGVAADTDADVALAGSAVNRIAANVNDAGARVEAWANSVPTPGGILVVLLVLFLFLWLIVPVNGQYTRGKLLWLTLMGQTSIKGSSVGSGTNGTGLSTQTGTSSTSLSANSDVQSLIQDFSS